MKKLCVSIILGAALASVGFGQEKVSRQDDISLEATKAFRDEIRMQKQTYGQSPASRADAGPSGFWDLESFGKGVSFLGSFYAGTVYVEPDCSAAALEDLGLVLAADDKCVTKAPDAFLPSQVQTDPAWQVTFPKNTAKNVFYLLLNNSVQINAFNSGPAQGSGGGSYSPQVTLVSEALNDPAAINPNTGLPMNGSFTTSLPGSLAKIYSLTPSQSQNDASSYGSVNGRGFSRDYFAAIGLPERVIDNIFKKDLTMKFGIRFGALPKTVRASYFYQFRVLGQ